MFDGAAVATGVTVTTDQVAQQQADAASSPDGGSTTDPTPDAAPTGDPQFTAFDQALVDALDANDAAQARQEIVFLSPSVRDYQHLSDGISPNVEVVVLDPARDGVQQMAEVLAGRTGIDAIHLIGEGAEAEMHLGASFLTQESISTRYAELFQQIGQSLSTDADILIYGCNFGRGEAGQLAINTVASLTGADIAASKDRTGHASEYANWELEVSTGFIETSVIIGQATQATWEGVLATYTVTTTTDGGTGSLRQAIIDANATPGTDTIIIPTGTYVLTIGKLIINDNAILTGAGAATTLIDGNAIDRVFETRGSSITTMSGVTIQNGRASGNGAGVFVDNSSILNLSDARLTNNNGTGGDGGAFHVHGTLNLNRVLIDNNLADNGAGIYFHNANGGNLTNVTISGNTATNEGGGIWTENPMTIMNSTIAFNTAPLGGGVYDKDGMEITITNSILHNPGSPNSFGTLISGGNNIDSDGTAGLGDPLDGQDPMLGGLADNGGPIWTHALLAGSPALNAGTTSGAPAVDQRGLTRDAAPDIGAYEYKSTAFVSKNEFTVNSPSGDNEITSGPVRGAERAVDIAPNGDYVVVWTNGTSNDKVFAKVLDASGNEKVAQFQINIGGGTNNWTDVAVDDSGNFVITWTQGNEVFMRRFLANGTAVDAGDVMVNTVTANTQQNPSVNMNGNGEFVIAWEGDGGGNEGIFVRQGSFGGGLVGSDITVDTAAVAKDPSVGIDESGNFVVVWDNGSDVFFQLYNSAGVPQNSGQVDIALQSNAGGAAVEMSGDGRFTVAYRATVLNVDVYVRQFDATGNPLFLPRLANSSILGTQTNPSISMDDIGEFIVVWEGAGSQLGQSDGAGVFGQKFNASGQKIGFEFLINQTTVNTQDRASVAMLDRDNFVAVWTGNDGAQTDVFARQYGATTSPTLDLDANDSSGGVHNDYAFTFSEGDGPTAIADADTDLADVDSTTFAYVTLSVSGLLDGNSETLVLDGDTFALATDAPGQDTTGGNYHVRVSMAAGTAIVTIIKQSGGTFSEIETEALIKAIQYQHQDTDAPSDGDRLIEVRVNDGTTDSAASRTTINVNPVNDAPVVDLNGAGVGQDVTTAFTEQTPVLIAPVETLTDVDSANLTGLTLTLTARPDGNGVESLSLDGMATTAASGAGLTVSYTAGTGLLSITGSATQALYQTVLQGVLYNNTSDTPTTSNRSITVVTNDGALPSAMQTATVTVTSVNDAPVVAGAGGTLAYSEGDGAQVIDSTFTVTDVDDTNIESATISLSGGFVSGEDVVDFVNTATITGLYNPATGVLTLTGSDTLAAYETALEGVTYENINTANPNAGARTVSWVINDGTANSAAVTSTITVTAVNDAPVITSNGGGPTASVTVPENSTVVTTVTSSDVDGGTAVYSIVPFISGGGVDAASFTIDSSTGVLSFVAAPDYEAPTDVGTDNVYDVTVQVSDGNGGAAIQALSIVVTDMVEGLPPTLPSPTIPPSLVPQPPPTSPVGEPPPAGSPPLLPPIVVRTPVNPDSNPETPVAPFVPGSTHGSTAPPASEMKGAPTRKGMNPAELSVELSHERGGFVEEGVAPHMYRADELVSTAFGGETFEKAQTMLSEAFRQSLGIVEEDLRRATDTSESSLKFAVGVTNLGGVSLTAGVITWLLRSGALLASMAATLPAWRHFDPLPVVLAGDRARRRSTAEMTAAADRENKQFRGLRHLFDKKEDKGRSDGEGREG